MENQMQLFKNEQFGDVRVIEEAGKYLFCGSDVAKALGYARPNDAITAHCRCTAKRSIPHPQAANKEIDMIFIPEGDVYRLIAHSKLPAAEQFERWVFDDVLPSIRKHGLYAADELLANPDLFIKVLQDLKEERARSAQLATQNAVQSQQIAEIQPKVSYYDLILQNQSVMPIVQIAKDYGLSARAMNRKLHELGVQYKSGGVWLLYQKYAPEGYTQTKTYLSEEGVCNVHTYWTQKGRLFLYDLLKRNGVLPLIEQNNEEVCA